MNKIVRISGVLLGLVALFVLLVAAISTSADTKLKAVKVTIDFAGENFFIDHDQIQQSVFDLGYLEDSTFLSEIHPGNIEHMLENVPYISDAEVYAEIDGTLHLDVIVRQPILRVYNDLGASAYIDQSGMIMPLSSKYTARTVVANGAITLPLNQYLGKNIAELPELSEHPDAKLLNDIYAVVKHCRTDPFWNAQFSQFFVNGNGEIEIIPRVGDHHILIGDATNLEKKLTKLKHFYAEGLNKTGWNEYKTINLKFANQVVCTKS